MRAHRLIVCSFQRWTGPTHVRSLSTSFTFRGSTRTQHGSSCSALPQFLDLTNPSVTVHARLERLLDKLSDQRNAEQHIVLGLDCEWARVRRGQRLRGVDLIQIAQSTDLADAVVLKCGPDVPRPLKAVLQNPRILKVVVGAQDATLLHRSGVHLRGSIDVMRVVRLLGWHEHCGTSLAGMYRYLCGKQLSKTEQCSDWGSAELSQEQIAYAARDATAVLEVLRSMTTRFYPTACSTAVFANHFVDEYVVGRNGDVMRTPGCLYDACQAALNRPDMPLAMREALLKADRARPKSSSRVSRGQFYAVAIGRKFGVYDTWDACKVQVAGYTGAVYKKFVLEKDARNFITSIRRNHDLPTCAS
eukprot:TRINITY_DN63834_c0_g1_i1.p1 TRINITY_DN63834_c0_g1~~TRINITY_DN63834_c0_g1_i1.p1  ORF type:complete len:360 (-),score=26.77 TRINITY_DN63834_c0_g1_i1:409-1488(-)